RVPASLPFLFSAFRVAATACVVGAVIGELPSSIQEGLGGGILNFTQYYSLTPNYLWATNLIAALLGISFFLAIVIIEKLVVRPPPEQLVWSPARTAGRRPREQLVGAPARTARSSPSVASRRHFRAAEPPRFRASTSRSAA